MSIMTLNLADNQLVYIKSCKGPTHKWKVFSNIQKTKISSNILLVCCKFFMSKMQ